MFSVNAKATVTDIRRVWSEIDDRKKEMFEEEIAYLEGQTDEWLQDFWLNEQKAVLSKSRRLAIKTMAINCCYGGLRILVCLAMLLALSAMCVTAFDDAVEFMKCVGSISVILFEIGLVLAGVSAILWFNRTMSEGVIKSTIAIQEILAEEYDLTSEYSEDVNSYAVLMLAASDLKFSARKRTQEDLEKMEEETADGIYTLNTSDDIPGEDVEELDYSIRDEDAVGGDSPTDGDVGKDSSMGDDGGI